VAEVDLRIYKTPELKEKLSFTTTESIVILESILEGIT